MSRRSARRLGAVCAAVLVIAVGAGCSAQQADREAVPDPVPRTTAADAEPTPSPGDVNECFAVADTYLSVTLLPLESKDPPADADATDPLATTADSVDDVVDSLPAEVRSSFRDAADRLRRDGHGLSPRELMEVRDTLEPVNAWLTQRCSAIEVDDEVDGGNTTSSR